MILAATLHANPERPKPDFLFIENSAMKIGIDRSMGASVTWLSGKAHPGNIINIHDPGRLLQPSYDVGKSLDRLGGASPDSQAQEFSRDPVSAGGIKRSS